MNIELFLLVELNGVCASSDLDMETMLDQSKLEITHNTDFSNQMSSKDIETLILSGSLVNLTVGR